MNKNKLVNLLFIIITTIINVVLILNNFIHFTSLDYILAIFLFLIAVYLLIKFIVYYSDSSLFLGTFCLFVSFSVFLYSFFNFSILLLINLIFFDILISFLMLFFYFNSKVSLKIFLCGLLIFFPILFVLIL